MSEPNTSLKLGIGVSFNRGSGKTKGWQETSQEKREHENMPAERSSWTKASSGQELPSLQELKEAQFV